MTQWHFARRATTHFRSPFIRPLLAVSTAITCVPAAVFGFGVVWRAVIRVAALGVVVAAPSTRPPPSTTPTSYISYFVGVWLKNFGLLSWPYPTRPTPNAMDSDEQSVPALANSPPPSSLSRADLINWKCWMYTRWCYTEEG